MSGLEGKGRYRLEGVDPSGVPWCVRTADEVEQVLTRRDELRAEAVRKGRQKTLHYFVFDSDDPERGFAEWCEECSVGDRLGAFGPSGLCARHRTKGT